MQPYNSLYKHIQHHTALFQSIKPYITLYSSIRLYTALYQSIQSYMAPYMRAIALAQITILLFVEFTYLHTILLIFPLIFLKN